MQPPKITIDLQDPPQNGGSQVVTRYLAQDKKAVDRAAKLSFMSTADFIRCVTVKAARQVIEQTKDQLPMPTDRRATEPDDDDYDPGTLPGS